MSNEDIVGSTAKLEALRQNALMRHQIRSEGVLDGGRTAGRMVGTPVGGIGGMAALLNLMGKSLGTKGKIGVGLAGALGGGLTGRAFGSAVGGITAGTAIPKLPPHMQTPVTPGSSDAVAATLAKAASDTNLIYRMEKTAFSFAPAARFLQRIFAPSTRAASKMPPGGRPTIRTSKAPPATPPATPPVPPPVAPPVATSAPLPPMPPAYSGSLPPTLPITSPTYTGAYQSMSPGAFSPGYVTAKASPLPVARPTVSPVPLTGTSPVSMTGAVRGGSGQRIGSQSSQGSPGRIDRPGGPGGPGSPPGKPGGQPGKGPQDPEASQRNLLSRLLFNKGTGLLGTTFAGGHIYNSVNNSVGSYPGDKPALYDRHAEVFKRNSEAADRASANLREEMEKARLSGDNELYDKLNERLTTGDYREDVPAWEFWRYRMGGLNPFGPDHGSTLQARMLKSQEAMRGHLDAAMKATTAQPGDAERVKALQNQLESTQLLPRQAEEVRKQLEMLQSRLKSPGAPSPAALDIEQRMRAAGMYVPSLTPEKPVTSGTTPGVTPYSSGWNTGGRTRSPGYATGASMMPAEFRPYQQAYDFVPPPSPKPTQHQGDF